MRKLLLLALFLYNIIALAIPNNYEYDDLNSNKRQSLIDRRNWRRKALLKSYDDHLKSDRRQDYDGLRYLEDQERLYSRLDGRRDLDASSGYGGHQYDNEREKEDKGKNPTQNCDRPHERYETCFSGCASVTCDNPRDRLRPCYPFCEEGCICVHPYVRDDRTHKCVLPEDCTKGLKGIPDLGEDV